MNILKPFLIMTAIIALTPGSAAPAGSFAPPHEITYKYALDYVSDLPESRVLPEGGDIDARSNNTGVPLREAVIEDTGIPLLGVITDQTGAPLLDANGSDDTPQRVQISP